MNFENDVLPKETKLYFYLNVNISLGVEWSQQQNAFSFFLYENISIEVLILMVQNGILKSKVNF